MRYGVPLLLLLALSCATGDRVQLPPGDAARGQQAFKDLYCFTCHTVEAIRTPAPTADTVVPLGKRRLSDEQLVTAIVHPDHEIDARYAADGARMAYYGNTMSIQQLVDLVAMLRGTHQRTPHE